MAIALIAVMLMELLLLIFWAPFFFRTGIVLFNQRIAASPAKLARLSLSGLEQDLPTERWMSQAFHALPDGSVAKVSQFFTSYGPSGPDGLAVDAQGHVLVANPGLGHVWVLNHRAEPVQVLRGVPGSSTTNLAFGGVQRKQLFVTDSTHGRILTTTLDTPGQPIHPRKN